MTVARILAIRTGRLYPPDDIPSTKSNGVRPEGWSEWKIPKTPSGIESATFRLVAQCLNKLRYRLPSHYGGVIDTLLLVLYFLPEHTTESSMLLRFRLLEGLARQKIGNFQYQTHSGYICPNHIRKTHDMLCMSHNDWVREVALPKYRVIQCVGGIAGSHCLRRLDVGRGADNLSP